MKKILLAGFILGISLVPFQPAHADWPVIDTSVLAQTIKQLQEMKRQYEELVSINHAVTGSYGVSLLENGITAQVGRREIPATWQEVVSLQQSGAIPGFYAQQQVSFQTKLPTVDVKLFSQNSANRNAVSYQLSTDNTRAAFAATGAVYNKIQDHLKTLEVLIHEIDRTDNVKNATDLNSRIVAENGFLSVEMARLNSLQLSLQTVLQNNQNQATANHAEFFGVAMK